jgi:hypothetical protein
VLTGRELSRAPRRDAPEAQSRRSGWSEAEPEAKPPGTAPMSCSAVPAGQARDLLGKVTLASEDLLANSAAENNEEATRGPFRGPSLPRREEGESAAPPER